MTSTVWARSNNDAEIFARMDNALAALNDIRDIYDDFQELHGEPPSLFIIATANLGSNALQRRSRAQMFFNRYTVTNAMRLNDFDRMRRPPPNMIVVATRDHQLESRENSVPYISVHTSDNAYIWIRGAEIQAVFEASGRTALEGIDIYSTLEYARGALDGVRGIYDNFQELHDEPPSLFIVTGNLGAITPHVSNEVQRIFGEYIVTDTMTFERFDRVRKPPNMIVISDTNYSMEDRPTTPPYIKIHASENAYIWIRGTEIQAVFENGGVTDLEEIIPYSPLEYARSALDGVRNIYDNFEELRGEPPSLFIVTSSLGDITPYVNDEIQRIFGEYLVTDTMPFERFSGMRKPRNMIVVSDTDYNMEDRPTTIPYIKIHASENAYIWIRGTEIQEIYERGTN